MVAGLSACSGETDRSVVTTEQGITQDIKAVRGRSSIALPAAERLTEGRQTSRPEPSVPADSEGPFVPPSGAANVYRPPSPGNLCERVMTLLSARARHAKSYRPIKIANPLRQCSRFPCYSEQARHNGNGAEYLADKSASNYADARALPAGSSRRDRLHPESSRPELTRSSRKRARHDRPVCADPSPVL